MSTTIGGGKQPRKKKSIQSKKRKLQWIRMIVWSYVILFIPALILLLYSILFLLFTGIKSQYQRQLSTVPFNGIWMLLASLMILLGCLFRDSRYFSACGIFLLPISMFLSLKSFLILEWLKNHQFPSTSTTKFLIDPKLDPNGNVKTSWQYNFCSFILFQSKSFEMAFIALFLLQLFLYVSCMLMPRWLNRSLRIHRILVRKLFLFQLSFNKIDESFYRY